MLITQKGGNLKSFDTKGKVIDWLRLEWHETGKRILHKRTDSGTEVRIKFMGESQRLQQDDILFEDESVIIAVEIMACEAIVLKPTSMFEMAYICYELGNKHLPLFYEEESLLIPYEHPVYKMLIASGMNPVKENRKLLMQLQTSVSAHNHSLGNESLFSKILKMTGAND